MLPIDSEHLIFASVHWPISTAQMREYAKIGSFCLHDCSRGATQNLAQTRKGKNTIGKEKRLLARISEKARKRLSRQNSTKKVRKCEGKKASILQKAQ